MKHVHEQYTASTPQTGTAAGTETVFHDNTIKHSSASRQAPSSAALQSTTHILEVHKFEFEAKQSDAVCLTKLEQFIRESEISKKIMGFAEKYPTAVVSVVPECSNTLGVPTPLTAIYFLLRFHHDMHV